MKALYISLSPFRQSPPKLQFKLTEGKGRRKEENGDLSADI